MTHVCDIYVPYVICTYMFVCVSCVTYYTGGICRQAARHGENPVLVVKLLVPIILFGRTCKAENFSKQIFPQNLNISKAFCSAACIGRFVSDAEICDSCNICIIVAGQSMVGLNVILKDFL